MQGPLTVTQRSLELGIRLSTLLFTLIYGTNLFLLTTAAEEVTVALEVLMRPLRSLNVPVTEIALTVTLALRFIPLVLEETQNLIRSVQTRAINWKKLGFRGSAQVWLAVIERLLKNLLLRAEQTAAAMQVRGFTTPNTHRVTWSELRLRSPDVMALVLLGVFWYARLAWGGEG
jgi:energy-coupling factor transport system permease protein